MTALREYERLEATGLWADAPAGQRREVIVAFGDATLVIHDSRGSTALSHWSLPAVLRLNPGESPALFAPGRDSGECLELTDPAMIRALTDVHRKIEARRPHPGRLRSVLLGLAMAAIALAGWLWIPPALKAQATSAVPEEKRREIGQSVLADVFRVSGSACAAPEGRAALSRLAERLGLAGKAEIIVLASGPKGARALPGGYVLLSRDAVEDETAPDIAAGDVLSAVAVADAADPLRDLLDWAGMVSAFRLITTGDLPAERIAGYAETLLSGPGGSPAPVALARLFEAAGVDPGAYAERVGGETGETLLTLPAGPAAPILSDADWVALQGICDG